MSYRTKWHVEVKMHLGRGNFCCNTLNLCCRIAAKMGARNLKGVSLNWAEWKKQGQEWGKFEEKICNIFLHQNLSFLSGYKWTWYLLCKIMFKIFESKGVQGLGFQMKDLVLCCIVAFNGKMVNNSYGLIAPWEFWPLNHTSNKFWILMV